MLSLLTLFAANCGGNFLGLVPWYAYLKDVDPNTCQIKGFTVLSPNKASDFPLVLVAVVDDLLRIAGLVAVGYIIYGGIQYVISQGNPEHTAKAQATIINALIGLALAIVAVAFVSFLGKTLGK
ncbi:MAG TPA: hypothetical protein VLG37_03735 [Candidatus Saccharimonadales bacterium]|nr:hypothetical protein [Candidatus Saccharimonadales bacterium]